MNTKLTYDSIKRVRSRYIKKKDREVLINAILNFKSVERFKQNYNIRFILTNVRPIFTETKEGRIKTTWYGDNREIKNNFCISINQVSNTTIYKMIRTIAHELCHIYQWNHSKEHTELTKELTEKLFNEFVEWINQ